MSVIAEKKLPLTKKQAKVCAARWIERWSYKRIGKEYGMTVAAVKKMLYRSKKTLIESGITPPVRKARRVEVVHMSAVERRRNGEED